MDFEGGWRLERRIDDHRADQVATFAGTATFARDQAGLAYRETGELTLPGVSPMRSERRYRWEAVDGQIQVLFDDGRFFHAFDPSGMASGDHWCAPDSYAVRYDFSEWPVWRSRWSVNGPRKDYVMESLFRRR